MNHRAVIMAPLLCDGHTIVTSYSGLLSVKAVEVGMMVDQLELKGNVSCAIMIDDIITFILWTN